MWIITTMHIQGLRLHHSKLYRGEGEFVQSWGRQVKKMEKEVRLLFCSYWKNKVSKIKESPMQDNESDQ